MAQWVKCLPEFRGPVPVEMEGGGLLSAWEAETASPEQTGTQPSQTSKLQVQEIDATRQIRWTLIEKDNLGQLLAPT